MHFDVQFLLTFGCLSCVSMPCFPLRYLYIPQDYYEANLKKQVLDEVCELLLCQMLTPVEPVSVPEVVHLPEIKVGRTDFRWSARCHRLPFVGFVMFVSQFVSFVGRFVSRQFIRFGFIRFGFSCCNPMSSQNG